MSSFSAMMAAQKAAYDAAEAEEIRSVEADTSAPDVPEVTAPEEPEVLVETVQTQTSETVPPQQVDDAARVDVPDNSESAKPAGESEPGVVSIPDGIFPGASAEAPSDEARVFDLVKGMSGSISNGGSAEDMLAGKHPRPSVGSDHEFAQYEKMRSRGLYLDRPNPWPSFMDFPTDQEIRALSKDEVTEEHHARFEEAKQLQAEAMMLRAKEINDWIFEVGTMRLNEKHYASRARRRDEYMKDAERTDDFVKTRPQDISDENLYGDPFYGIKWASLLNPDPGHLDHMKKLPVAQWGHDEVIMQDGGRLQARDGEIKVSKISCQAAQMLVMEAKQRGWETIRVSGDTGFCRAVKLAVREAGLGAVIHDRGAVGIGIGGKREVIMPPLPKTNLPEHLRGVIPEEKKIDAPKSDLDAADALDQGRKVKDKPKIKVEDPMADLPEVDEDSSPRPGA